MYIFFHKERKHLKLFPIKQSSLINTPCYVSLIPDIDIYYYLSHDTELRCQTLEI